MKYYYAFVLALLPMLAACGNPIAQLKQEIQKNGYILYQTPLADAGTGTLVGGKPNAMALVARSQDCFPDTQVNGLPLRSIQDAAIGNYSQAVTFSGDAKVELSNFMQTGNAMFTVGAGIDTNTSINLVFGKAHVETIDRLVLNDYYDHMESYLPTARVAACKEWLNSAGFIVQALRVDGMQYSFTNAVGGNVQLTLDNIMEYLNIDVNVKYHIEQGYLLTFDTPKYIGYALGRLQTQDQGMSLYQANSVVLNNYVFKSVSIFGNSPTP